MVYYDRSDDALCRPGEAIMKTVLTLVSVILVCGTMLGEVARAKVMPQATPGVTTNPGRAVENALVRAATDALAVAGVLDGGCALASGREPECWSTTGAPRARRIVPDGIVSTILRQV